MEYQFHAFHHILRHFWMEMAMLINWMLWFKRFIKKSLNTSCKKSELLSDFLSWCFLFFSYPNADELRSIVSRLVDRHPHSLVVIGSVELLVRKLYYKFCNERKKYPVELKRRQPNKRKRLTREEELTQQQLKSGQTSQDLDRCLHLWNTTLPWPWSLSEVMVILISQPSRRGCYWSSLSPSLCFRSWLCVVLLEGRIKRSHEKTCSSLGFVVDNRALIGTRSNLSDPA